MVQRIDFRQGGSSVIPSCRTCATCGCECDKEITIDAGKLLVDGGFKYEKSFCSLECSMGGKNV